MVLKLQIDAFHATEPVARVLEEAACDRLFAKSRLILRPGGLAAALSYYGENPAPPLVILEEAGEDDQVMLGHLAALAGTCAPGTKLMVIGRGNDIATYRQLVALGISDYLVAPVTAQEIVQAVLVVTSDPAAAVRGRSIAVFGARGGTGASTLAQKLARFLGQAVEEDVILIDLDLTFGTSALSFALEARDSLAQVLAAPEPLDEAMMERLLIRQDKHLHVLCAPPSLARSHGIDAEALEQVIDLARQMVAYVVLDIPHLWQGWTRECLCSADETVVVALPDMPNLQACAALFETLRPCRGEDRPPRLVLNRVDAWRRGQLAPQDFTEALGVAPMASLGRLAGGGRQTEALRQLALQLSGRPLTHKKQPSLMAWLRGMRKRGGE
ncbi:AAA family ATPase [Telmatospirillum sp. J64-1]|uniref:AAA family ATPase n=1 Tax=Telmatospirillum sp. J64-1 TaxID=2502183 RepID=UPI00163DB15E|nr:AAA family ATPase [Telmatospirillum sp. J64-1]